MNTPPPSKSITPTTNPPPDAQLRSVPSAAGAPKVAAEGDPTAVLPDRQTGDGRYPIAWLRITAPGRATPTAASWCRCGRDLFAAGQQRVLALIADHTTHRDACALRTTQEERNAA